MVIIIIISNRVRIMYSISNKIVAVYIYINIYYIDIQCRNNQNMKYMVYVMHH